MVVFLFWVRTKGGGTDSDPSLDPPQRMLSKHNRKTTLVMTIGK